MIDHSIKNKRAYAFALYCLVLLSPNILQLNNIIAEKSIAVVVFYMLFSISFAVLPLLVLSPRYFGILMLPFVLIVPVELIHVFNYDGFVTLAGITSAANTNVNELKEFLYSYRIYLYLTLPLIFLSIYLFIRNVDHNYKVGPLAKYIIALLFLFSAGAFTIKTIFDISMGGSTDIRSGLAELSRRLVMSSYPGSMVYKLIQYYEQKRIVESQLEKKNNFKFNALSDGVFLGNNPVILLVIGETARRYNWQIYGYPRETTPNLSNRPDLLVFRDVTTVATHTSQAVQLVLSRATPHNFKLAYKEKNIISAFRESGYYTVWLSNQNMTGGVDTVIYSMSIEANERRFMGGDYNSQPKLDEVLIPELHNILEQHSNKPLFIVIHTMGSHEIYRMRYPVSFEKFQPASKGDDYNFNSPGIKERLLNSYDNSILYTDYILDKIIDTVDFFRRPSALIYFSDHGENLLDGNDGRFGHGGVIPTMYVTDVPFFAWLSDEYESEKMVSSQALRGNLSKPASTLNVFDTLLDLGMVTIPGYDNSLSLAREYAYPEDRYILNSEYKAVSYNELKKQLQVRNTNR